MLFFRQSMKASLYQRRLAAQVFTGRLLVLVLVLAGADGGGIARRHGGQREEESEPPVWPQRPAQLPGQLQVRALLRESVVVGSVGPGGCA